MVLRKASFLRWRLRTVGVIVLAILCASVTPAQVETKSVRPISVPRKIALVIGNSRYQHIPSIPTASNDADDMARAFHDLSFDEVIVEKDLTADGLISAVARFMRASVQPGDLAVVYYSGHGGQVGEENFLLPVDYDPPSEDELVERRAYRMSRLRDALEHTGARVRVLVFDACRNSPVTTTKGAVQGLREMDGKPEGTLIAYASAHNQVARYIAQDRNSLYTAELLPILRRSQTDLRAVFEQVQRQVFERTGHQQTPYLYGFLSAPLYLNGEPTVPRATPPPAETTSLDAEAWQAVKESRDVRVFERFIREFPNSQYVRLAALRIETLAPGTHTGGGGSASVLTGLYNRAYALERNGHAREAFEMYADAYARGRAAIGALPTGQVPEALKADFINAGYRYCWFLLDIGESKQGAEVLKALESFVGSYNPATLSPALFAAYGRFENLELRQIEDRKSDEAQRHSARSLDIGSRAAGISDSDLDALRVAFNAYSNEASGAARDEFEDRACAIADRMFAAGPRDVRAIEVRVSCLQMQAENAASKGNRDGASQKFEAARKVVLSALQMFPEDSMLGLSMASLETRLGDLESNQAARPEHQKRAREYFIKAVSGKTIFQSNTTQLKNLYTNLIPSSFSSTDEELAFYRQMVDAVKVDSEAFPKAPGTAYVVANAAGQMGELLKSVKRLDEAATWLQKALQQVAQAELMPNIAHFSEDSGTICRLFASTANLMDEMGHADRALSMARQTSSLCELILEKYPWDFYLRIDVINARRLAGKLQFDSKNYRVALPDLEYASHWGDSDSTRLLAQAYREGLGAPANPSKAQSLLALAAKQRMLRFTFPADFNGVKADFNVYVRQWPEDYQYKGIDDQIMWLKEARGGVLPPEIGESLRALDKIARDGNKSYPDMVAEALKPDPKTAPKK
jgi:tetratricopeptide (TPR) repeat protein